MDVTVLEFNFRSNDIHEFLVAQAQEAADYLDREVGGLVVLQPTHFCF